MSVESREDRCVRLLHEHDRALRRLAASYERDPGRQQDLVQDIWLAVWQALPRFRGESSERTFVFRIAHNRAISHIDYSQRRRAEPLSEDAPIPAPGSDPEHTLSTQQRHAPPAGRAATAGQPAAGCVLALEGVSHAEIADIVGITENNVAVRLSRARATLSRQLGAVEVHA